MEIQETLETQMPEEQAELKKPRGRKPGKRKGYFRMDTPPFPVRALWEAASPEEQKKAHNLGIQMRGYHDFGVSKQEYRAGVKMKGEA